MILKIVSFYDIPIIAVSLSWPISQLAAQAARPWGENHVKTIFKIMAELVCKFEYATNWKSDFGYYIFLQDPSLNSING